jgi:decaprenyl-phosphate phosphoribosyltransferase
VVEVSTKGGGVRAVPGTPLVAIDGEDAAVALDKSAWKSLSATSWNIILTMRPRQWVKNLLIFVAPAAARVLTHQLDLLRSLAAFGIFCAVASGVYLINDAIDAGADRLHPDKQNRPVARGVLSRTHAIAAGALFIVVGLLSAWFVARWELVLVVGIYVIISIAYTIRLKREPVIELVSVASGFVLRAIAGGVATRVPLSSWFLAVASFGALFVVTGKRVGEQRRLGETRGHHRQVLDLYTASFLRSTLTLTATVTVTAYCLWAFDRGGQLSHAAHHFVWIQLSVIPIILGTLHMLRLLDAGLIDLPDDLVFHDHLLQVLAAFWVVLFSIGIYG